MAHYIKQTTGIVGLAVEPHARDILKRLLSATLVAVKPFPVDSYYRTEVPQRAGRLRERACLCVRVRACVCVCLCVCLCVCVLA